MGEKSKKDKKRKHSETDDESDDDRQQKHRSKDKKAKKEKSKDSKKDSDRLTGEEKRLLKEAKKLLKKRQKELDAPHGGGGGGVSVPDEPLLPEGAPIEPITEDDYFAKNPEFSTWLRERKGVFFNEITSDAARELFTGFVELWNRRQLAAKYYQGMQGATMRRTQHSWAVRGGSEGVGRLVVGMDAALEEEREAARQGSRGEARRWRKDQKEQVDELLPKATGREAKVEARAGRREEKRAREESPEITKLPGGGNVMGGDDSFAAARAREDRQAQWRTQKGASRNVANMAKVAEFSAREDATMAQFRSMLAEKTGPMQIRKRE